MTQYYAPGRDEDDQIMMMAFFDDLTEEQQKQIITVLRKHNQKDVLRAWGETDCGPEEIEQQHTATAADMAEEKPEPYTLVTILTDALEKYKKCGGWFTRQQLADLVLMANTMTDSLERAHEGLAALQAERDGMAQENARKDRAISILENIRDKRDDLEQQRDTLRVELNTARKEIDRLRGLFSTASKERDAATSERDKLRVDLQTTLNERNAARNELRIMSGEISVITATRDAWKRRCDEHRVAYRELKALADGQTAQLHEAKQTETELKKERNDARQRSWQQVVTIEQLRKEVDLHQRANADLRKENDALAAMMPVSYEHDREPTALSLSVSMAEMMKQAIIKELEPGGLIHNYATASAAK